MGGDFNLVRFQSDKSNGVINHRWSDKFNAWVEIWSLLEVKLRASTMLLLPNLTCSTIWQRFEIWQVLRSVANAKFLQSGSRYWCR
jgi:hypothetical protein